MPTVRIETPFAALLALASSACQEIELTTVTTRQVKADHCTIRHRARQPTPEVAAVRQLFDPFAPSCGHDASLDVDIAVTLGDRATPELSRYNVTVSADTRRLRDSLTEEARSLGFGTRPAMTRIFAQNVVQYGGATAFARAVIAFQAARHGIRVSFEKAWGDDDMDIHCLVSDPKEATKPLPARVPVIIRTDQPSAFPALRAALSTAGFTELSVATFTGLDEPRLAVLPGPLRRLEGHVEIALLAAAVDQAARDGGIDTSRYPVQLPDPSASGPEDRAEIHFPAAAIRGGIVWPWARGAPERYTVRLQDDDPTASRDLEQRLHKAGFRRTERRTAARVDTGFGITCGSEVPPTLAETVRGIAADALAAAGIRDFPLELTRGKGSGITITFPARAARSGRLLAELAAPARHSCKVIGPTAAVCKLVADGERGRGWRALTISVDTDDNPPGIFYGGAHPSLVENLQRDLQATHGILLPALQQWGLEDMDVFLRLPASIAMAKAGPAGAAVGPVTGTPTGSPSGSLAGAGAANGGATAPDARARPPTQTYRPFIVAGNTEIQIGDVTLPRRRTSDPLVPGAAMFSELVIDQEAAETMAFFAEAWKLRHHVALEGSTGVSKTFLIGYFAHLLGLPMYRVNLTATSDAHDIIGRFVPDTAKAGSFKWVDGALPRAMTGGGLLVLDEANLAPTELLERCNGAMEAHPQLVLTENDNRVIRGHDVHLDFRVFASWNGSDYAGRQELAPSLKDRFKLRIVAPATEADYIALGRRLVYGEQPAVTMHGVRYAGGLTGTPVLPRLRQVVRELDRFITALARLQVSLERAAADGSSGGQRVVYTRRSFVDALRLMNQRLAVAGRTDRDAPVRAAWRALRYSHFERLAPGEKAQAIDLAAACGLRPDGWSLPS